MSKQLIQNFLGEAGIQVDGPNPWDIHIKNDHFYRRLLRHTDLALGESYMDNWWDCLDLDQFFYRVFSAGLNKKVLFHPKFWRGALSEIFFARLRNIINYQTQEKSRIVGEQHYDIGNDLYQAMLDKRMVYTCAYWKNASNLDQAQEEKLALTCQKLKLEPGMTVLDIGCGWGSFAQYAAEKHGVSVVGLTISKEQVALGQKRCAGLPVDIRLQDYRELANSALRFDRIVSLGMFEHVGYKNYKNYMKIAAQCLKEDGIFLLHTIGNNISSTVTSRWINTYIFPNGQLPSIAQLGTAIEGIFVMEDWHNFGADYDRTLMAWHHNFNAQWDQLKQQYSERFRRMWNYYLLSSAASFRARQTQLWQIVLSKHGLRNGYTYSETLQAPL